mgnify:CR=1 FL=1
MVDIGARNFVLATLNPLMREGGLLAALPADKAAFEAHFRLAGARAGVPDNPSAPRTQQPASHQYKSSEPVAQQRPSQAESSAAAQRDDKRQYESASAAPQAAQPQSGQPAEAHRQHDETAGEGNNQPQEPRDSVAADQSKPADCKHPQSCQQPRAKSDQQQTSGNQFVTSEESAFAIEAETAAAMSLLEATTKSNKSKLHQHLPDAPIADANVQAANDGHTSMSAPAADQSAMQSAIQAGMHPAMQTANGGDSGASGDEAADFLQQSGMAAAAIATDPIADAVLADDKPRPMRASGRGKSSAPGEVRGAGDTNAAQKEQAAVAASGQPAVSQVAQTAAASDAFATQPAGESANGKSDAALGLARQNSGAQQSPGASQPGKEKASAPVSRATEAPTSDKTQGESTADRVRFVQRVARAFEAIGARAGTVRLRLSPPELGTLRVEIAVRDGALSARLQAENHTVRNLLLDNLPALRERLAQQDIRIDRFQVDIFDQSQTSNWQQPAGQSDWQQPGRYRAQLGEPMTPSGTQSVRLPTGVHRSSSESQLDVLI